MHRRLLLAGALVALLAGLPGCAHAAGSLSMTPVDEGSLAESASRSPADVDRPAAMSAGDVVRRAIENGTTTEAALHPPVGTGLPFRHDGGFYNLSYAVAGSSPGYRADVEVDYNASAVTGDVVAYEDLPTVDRRTVDTLMRGPREQQQEGYDFGVGVTYGEAEAESSVFLTERSYDAVRYEGDVYPIRVSETESVTLTNYRYEAELVAESPDAYADHVVDRYEFELSGLSDAERDVVDQSLNGTYYPESTGDDGFDALVVRFRGQQSVSGDEYSGSWVVRYEGQRYWVEMDYGAFVQDSDAVTSPEVTPPPE